MPHTFVPQSCIWLLHNFDHKFAFVRFLQHCTKNFLRYQNVRWSVLIHNLHFFFFLSQIRPHFIDDLFFSYYNLLLGVMRKIPLKKRPNFHGPNFQLEFFGHIQLEFESIKCVRQGALLLKVHFLCDVHVHRSHVSFLQINTFYFILLFHKKNNKKHIPVWMIVIRVRHVNAYFTTFIRITEIIFCFRFFFCFYIFSLLFVHFFFSRLIIIQFGISYTPNKQYKLWAMSNE